MTLSISRLIHILIFVTLIFAGSAGAVMAADEIGAGGSGPDTALAPMAGWVTLENGTKHWYAFTDGGDENDVEVRMAVSPADHAVFEVWTSEQLREWQNGDAFDPVGAGTANKNLDDDLFWTGNFVASNTYYVVVHSRNFGPTDYQLIITGDDVGFPSAATEATVAVVDTAVDDTIAVDTEVAADEAVAVEAGAVKTGDEAITEESFALIVEDAAVTDSDLGAHAGVALAPTGETTVIGPGETHWYAFRDEGDQGTIQAVLDASPNIGVLFEVWTAEQLREWQNGEDFDPVGAGTENKGADIDQYWSGSFVRSGNYYVVVRHTGLIDGSSEYSLSVTGDDVSY